MNPLAKELNEIILETNPYIYEMLSKVGKKLFFPKGILSQTAEAKEKAYKFNATIGMATEKEAPMYLPSIMKWINLPPEKSITYAPATGIPELRKLWKEYLYKKNPSLNHKEISLPIVTHAITHGLSVVADIWVDSEDIILLPDKMWGNYRLIFEVRKGAKIVNYPFFEENKKLNIKEFQKTLKDISEKSKKIVIILNFPNNPTGYSPTISEAEHIKEILLEHAEKGTNIVAVIDDAYFGLVYEEGILKESIFSYLACEHPRILSIKLDAATKEDFVWGLRVGFLTYGIRSMKKDPEHIYYALEKKTAGAIRGSISNANHVGQEILLSALKDPHYPKEKEQKFHILKERAEEIKRILSTNSKYTQVWDVYPFNSGYFMCLKIKGVDAEKLRKYLLERYGIGIISLNNTDIRIAFSSLEKGNLPLFFEELFKAILELQTL